VRGLSSTAGSLTETLRQAAAHERLVFLCSFQKEESVILDELLAVAPHVRVVTIDTGVLFPETLATWRAFEECFDVRIEVEEAIAKYNPLALWTERDLWTRIHERGLPYHPLHDQGYESIGCAPCTQPGSGRDGRWAGLDKTECGLHV
jgi:phosphoadenosine phosphosulfate reductase